MAPTIDRNGAVHAANGQYTFKPGQSAGYDLHEHNAYHRETIGGQEFEWDTEKAKKNEIKHNGVTFPEAATVWSDPSAITESDEKHSYDEQRYTKIGISSRFRLLYVSFCDRLSGKVKRLISARSAEKPEQARYGSRGTQKKHNRKRR